MSVFDPESSRNSVVIVDESAKYGNGGSPYQFTLQIHLPGSGDQELYELPGLSMGDLQTMKGVITRAMTQARQAARKREEVA